MPGYEIPHRPAPSWRALHFWGVVFLPERLIRSARRLASRNKMLRLIWGERQLAVFNFALARSERPASRALRSI
jgi:hypothetical protein